MRDALQTAADRSVLLRCGARSSSGWLLDGYLVAPGVLLTYEQAKRMEKARDPSSVAPSISVVVRRGPSKSSGSLDAMPTAAAVGKQRAGDTPRSDDVLHAKGHVVALWRCEDLYNGLQGVLDEWKLSREDSESDEGQDDAGAESRHLLSLFLLLRLSSSGSGADRSARGVLGEALRLAPELPPRGEPLCLACAPLGAPALLGAVSMGVVSGVSPGGLLMLTDARAAPGSEGAPVYSVREAAPVALVLSPLSWWRGEAVGFTLCVPLRRVLKEAMSLQPSPAPTSALLPAHRERQDLLGSLPPGVDRGVVLVRCGHLWGSGFLVDKENGVVLTCAHVVGQSAETATVRWGRHSLEADVVWRAASGVPFDVAVLKLHPDPHLHHMQELPLDLRVPVLGETVFAAGYPLFSETLAPEGWRLQPLVSRGQVSGWWPSACSQVLTTCTVQSGASGGPLLRLSGDSASVIGVLVCTAQLGTGRDSVVYPNVNLALWVQAIVEPVRRFLQSGDANDLDDLRCESTAIQRQWKLEPPRMSKL